MGRGRRRRSRVTEAGAGAGAGAGLPSMVRAQPPPHFATSAAAAPGLSGFARIRAVGSGKRWLPGAPRCVSPSIRPKGRGALSVGVSAVAGRREKPQSAPLGCGVTAALAAWLGRNPRMAPLEMSQLLAGRDTQPGRPSRLRASSRLCQRSLQGRRELKCLAGLPGPRQVAKADGSARPPPSLPTDFYPGTGSAP